MKKLLATLLVTLSLSAHADFKDGNKLYSQMLSSDTTDNMVALGYVTGIVDAYNDILICVKGNVTAGQINDIIKQYLYNNPAIRDQVAATLVMNALTPIWPCKKKSSNERTL